MGTLRYQWYSNGAVINGATATSLTLTQAQVGTAITLHASYTDKLGTAEAVSSAATGNIINVNDAPTGGVQMKLGTATVTATTALKQGDVLTASNTLADADGLGAINYQWFSNGTAISGETASTLAIGQAQVGSNITLQASYTDGYGTAEVVNSIGSAVVGIGANTLVGKAGVDLLFGGAGNDNISDTVNDASNALFGGSGNDTLKSGTKGDFLAGGTGTDTLTLGGGADVVAFNSGDGADTLTTGAGVAASNATISLGGGIKLSDLTLQKSGTDLILNTNAASAEKITIKNWYAATPQKGIANLQLIVDANTDYLASSTDTLKNKRVVNLNFQTIVTAFNSSGTDTGNSWSVMNAALTAYLSGSDNSAIGGELAYQYGENKLPQLSETTAQSTLSGATFGSSQQGMTVGLTLPNGQVGLVGV